MSVEDLIHRCVVEGRARWPGVVASDDAVTAQLAQQLADAELASIHHPADLFLAAAAALQDPIATRCVHDRVTALGQTANRTLLSRADLDEVMQTVAVRLLFAPPPDKPQICRYLGTGPLDAWLRAVLVRAGLSARRQQKTAKPETVLDEEAWLELPIVLEGPGAVAFASRTSPHALRDAFKDALAKLTQRQRLLLRQHFIDGVSSNDLGRIYGVHRVTVFRWIGEAKAIVLAAMREFLSSALAGSPSEIDSILRGLRSGFSVSIERLLPAQDDGEPT